MEKSKLLDIFHVIPANERRLFLEYVQSPFFNKRKNVMVLCQYLIDRSKENFPPHKMNSEYCWQKIFPSKKFNKKQMAYLMSDLCQLGESFLGQRHYEQKGLNQALTTLEALAIKGLDKSYTQHIKYVHTIIKNSSLQDTDHYWSLYKLATIEDLHFGLQNLRQYNHSLTTQNNFLDQFFTLRKLQIFCNMHYQKKVLGVDQKMTWPSPPGENKNTNNASQVHIAYQSLYQLLMNSKGSEKQFLAFRALLPELKSKLSTLEYIDMFSFAINYCLLEINKGKRVYTKHLLALYEEGLKQGSLLVNNELSPWMYKNIVKLGLGLKRFEWTEEFILIYSNKLPKDQRKDALHFNLANLNYFQKNYDLALEYLNQVEFTDVFYKHGAKAILLKIYFEKNETEAFFALESSFKILLLRDKYIPNDLKTNYLNFIRFTSKIFKLNNRNDINAMDKLRSRIEKTPNINGRNWVVQQLDNIGKSRYK